VDRKPWQDVNEALQSRTDIGYPKAGFEQRAVDVSVSYLQVAEGYRNAKTISVRQDRADASTEEPRTSIIHFRTIFGDLIQDQKSEEKWSAA
jgi:hypothetical protein